MIKEIIRITLRLDSWTHKKIQTIASNNKRSLNAQIDFILESYIKDYEKFNGEVKFKP